MEPSKKERGKETEGEGERSGGKGRGRKSEGELLYNNSYYGTRESLRKTHIRIRARTCV